MPMYECKICGNDPDDQKSHHDKHLRTKKHQSAKRIRQLELEKMSTEDIMAAYGTTNISEILANMETFISDKPEITKKVVSGEMVWTLDGHKDANENYTKHRSELQSVIKACHQCLYSRCAIVGIKAQNDIMRLLCVKILQNQFKDQSSEIWRKCDEVKVDKNMSDAQFERFKNYCSCLLNITKADNIEKDWKAFVMKFLMPLFPTIYYEDDATFNCRDTSVITELIKKIDCIVVSDEFSDAFATSCGDIHELFREYDGGKGAKALGQYFTPRKLIHLIFYGIGLADILAGIENVTVYDPCMGTGGFLSRLFNMCKIESSNVYGCETEIDTIKFGEMSMVLTTGNTNTNIVKCDSLCENPFIHGTRMGCIVTNPPFGTSMNYDILKSKFTNLFPDSTVSFEEMYPIKTNNGACLFIQHCVYMLENGGVCAIVLPDGELFEGNSQWSKRFRKWFCESVNIRTILKAPSGVFEHAGVKTNVVIFTNDGPTQSIRFLETNKQCDEVRDMFSVHMDELVATKFSLDVGEYIEDVSENYDVPMVALGDIFDLIPGKIQSSKTINEETGYSKMVTMSTNINDYKTINHHNLEGKNLFIGNIDSGKKFAVRYYNGQCDWINILLHCKLKIKVSVEYLYYYIKNLEQYFTINYLTGSSNLRLNKVKLLKFKIPLPSLEVQQQIVDELTLVEESTTTIQMRLGQMNREKEQYRKYGKKAEIRALLEGSESKMLGDVCEINGGTRIVKKECSSGIYPVYGSGEPTFTTNNSNRSGKNIIVGRFALSEKCVRIIEGDIYLNDSGLSVHNDNPVTFQYIGYYLLFNQSVIYNLSRGQAQRNLNMNKFKELKIPLPSLEIQEQCIAIFEEKEAYIESIDKKIEESNKYLDELKAMAKDIITSFC